MRLFILVSYVVFFSFGVPFAFCGSGLWSDVLSGTSWTSSLVAGRCGGGARLHALHAGCLFVGFTVYITDVAVMQCICGFLH